MARKTPLDKMIAAESVKDKTKALREARATGATTANPVTDGPYGKRIDNWGTDYKRTAKTMLDHEALLINLKHEIGGKVTMKYPATLKMKSKKRIFCDHYFKYKNARTSAEYAGYVASYGVTLLTQEAVIDYLEELSIESRRLVITNDADILARITRIADRAFEEGKLTDSLRALDMLGKNRAMWIDKQLITTVEERLYTGDTDEAIQTDIDRLTKVAAPKLKLKAIKGGKT